MMKKIYLEWGIYSNTGNSLELEEIIVAVDYEEAVEKARRLGYGKNYEVREFTGEAI